ncbi:MAG TPA: type II toxin-antitoxin system Phd/YefM family antitoxin [Caulobacteraceae bacterium]|jgi:prevent-host-death family protein
MTTTTLSARQFNQDSSKVRRAAQDGPVVITDRGRPSLVVMTYQDYQQLTGRGMSLAEALAADDDVEFDPPRLRDDIAKPVDFG